MREPLTMPWKQAWKVLPSSRVLHRVAVVNGPLEGWSDDPDDVTWIRGVTCCGREGDLIMPGLFSRMGLPRCAGCCRAAGVGSGGGIPGNGDQCGPMDAWQVRE